MKNHYPFTLLLFVFLAWPGTLFGDASEGHGRSEYAVVVSDSATPIERRAGALLEAAGFRVQGSGVGGTEGQSTIYVGPGLASMTLVGGSGGRVDWGALGQDGIVVLKAGNGENWKAENRRGGRPSIVLAGGRPRGTTHAVVAFLEEQAG